MDQYFNDLSKITREKKISFRVKFLIEDLVQLRQNKWIKCCEDEVPKTIVEIRREAQRQNVCFGGQLGKSASYP